MYIRNLLQELGFAQNEPTLVWEDNKACILLAEQETSSAGRCKHIDIKFRFVAEALKDQIVRVRYTPSDMNLADLLTKALPPATFHKLVTMSRDRKGLAHYVDQTDVNIVICPDLFMILGV